MSTGSAPSAILLGLSVPSVTTALPPLLTLHNSLCSRVAQDLVGKGRNRDRHLPSHRVKGENPLNAINERFMASVKIGDIIETFYYLLNGADVNCCQRDRNTALYIAASNGYLDLMHMVLSQRGVRVNKLGPQSETALHRTVANQFMFATSMLLQHGANVNAYDAFQRTPLHTAIMLDNQPMVQLLLKYGAQVNTKDCFGDTPTHAAALKFVNCEILKTLLDSGADPNVRGPCGNMVLHLAVCALSSPRQLKVIKLLVRHGASVNAAATTSLRTPLHAAAMSDNTDVLRLLLDAGAEFNALTCMGKTPAATARQYRCFAAAEVLDEAKQLEDTPPATPRLVDSWEEVAGIQSRTRSTRWSRFKQRFSERMTQWKICLQRLSPMYSYYW